MRSKNSKSANRRQSGGRNNNIRKSKKAVQNLLGFGSHPHRLNSKNGVHDISGIKQLKLPAKPSFAVKLGAYMLQGLDEEVFFSKKTAFSNKQSQVSGILPLLHMNIKEHEFRDMLNSNAKSMSSQVEKNCNAKDLNKKLVKVGFNCKKQSGNCVVALNMALIDSINNRYHLRKNGQKHLARIFSCQTWQNQQPDKKIPNASLNYGK